MTTEQVAAFLLFAVVAAVTPGPSNIMLTAAGAHAGVLRGLPCLFGVSLGMGLMMFLVPARTREPRPRSIRCCSRPSTGAAPRSCSGCRGRSRRPPAASKSIAETDPVGYRGRRGLSVGQPEVLARERERGRDVSQRRSGQPHRAGGLPRRPLRLAALPALLPLAGVRRRRPARPPWASPTENLQHRHGGAARACRSVSSFDSREAGAHVCRRADRMGHEPSLPGAGDVGRVVVEIQDLVRRVAETCGRGRETPPGPACTGRAPPRRWRARRRCPRTAGKTSARCRFSSNGLLVNIPTGWRARACRASESTSRSGSVATRRASIHSAALSG